MKRTDEQNEIFLKLKKQLNEVETPEKEYVILQSYVEILPQMDEETRRFLFQRQRSNYLILACFYMAMYGYAETNPGDFSAIDFLKDRIARNELAYLRKEQKNNDTRS